MPFGQSYEPAVWEGTLAHALAGALASRGKGVWAPLSLCGGREPLVASGHQRPTRPWVLLGGFHKPGQGQAWATRLPCGPRQEELVADVSPCANLWLLASGAFYPPACQGGSLGPSRAQRPCRPGWGPHGCTDRPPWLWVPKAWRWSLVRGLDEAGLEFGGLPRCGVLVMAHVARRCPPPACCCLRSGGPRRRPCPLQPWFPHM